MWLLHGLTAIKGLDLFRRMRIELYFQVVMSEVLSRNPKSAFESGSGCICLPLFFFFFKKKNNNWWVTMPLCEILSGLNSVLCWGHLTNCCNLQCSLLWICTNLLLVAEGIRAVAVNFPSVPDSLVLWVICYVFLVGLSVEPAPNILPVFSVNLNSYYCK